MNPMKEKNLKEIVKLARVYSKNKMPWHHHFLTLRCAFNKTKKYQIILENEKTEERFVAKFNHKPMKELELLENIFFKRKK